MRLLKANEIDVRVGSCKEKGASLLLYKNARVDMQLMDEEYGALNWKREHIIINGNNYCRVSVWNENTKEWVSKEDCGTESNTEKEKGEASDSFKRACVNWGIGRELYSGIFIYVKSDKMKIETKNGKSKTFDKFSVKEIEYNDERTIVKLVIVNQYDKVVFTHDAKKTNNASKSKTTSTAAPKVEKVNNTHIKSLHTRLNNKGITDAKKKKYLMDNFKLESSKDLDVNQYKKMMDDLAKMPDKKEEHIAVNKLKKEESK